MRWDEFFIAEARKTSASNRIVFVTINENHDIPVERHPLEPFLPSDGRILMLGSFPPPRQRWSMNFFYPNKQNDMWRIMGLLFSAIRIVS